MEMAIADPRTHTRPKPSGLAWWIEEVLDASVRPVLTAKVRMGLLDQPYVDEERARKVLADLAIARWPVSLRSARRAASQRGRPAAADGPRLIAVIGPLADSRA